jgi:hypothetical protein
VELDEIVAGLLAARIQLRSLASAAGARKGCSRW